MIPLFFITIAVLIAVLIVLVRHYFSKLIKELEKKTMPKKEIALRTEMVKPKDEIESNAEMQVDTELSVLLEIRNELWRNGDNWLPAREA